ncbi:ABC transporter permease subunit [Chitinimonas sp.]|uniref:ABC transporter permease n=1 Tax=Chitinimonas sp. TaxID=1934313 RepID=UPI002F93646F
MEEYVFNVLAGAKLTLQVAGGSLVVAVVLGLLGATAKLSTNKPLNWLAALYSTIIRGIPELVWMLLLFYGGQMLLNKVLESVGYNDYVEINPLFAGIVTIGFIYGAYMTETFRGAIMAIPKGQSEAGYAFGMSRSRVFFRIVVPQMIRLALPSFTNNWLVLIKATALVSVIGLTDMTMLAKQASAATRSLTPLAPMLFYLLVAAIYLAITTVSLIVLKQLDKRYSMGVRKGEF